MKTLFLHAGGSKAGSSAIQNYFELNADAFHKQGIAYENKTGVSRETDITCGNGVRLYEALDAAREPHDSAALDAVIFSYFGDCDRAICTSEFFEKLPTDKWVLLADAADRLDVNIHLIFYVRNTAPYLLSAYDQIIKYHGEYRSFQEWLRDYRWLHVDFLRAIHPVLERVTWNVGSYDKLRANLIADFLVRIGAKAPRKGNIEKSVVNRSLTRVERDRLRRINQIFGPMHAKELTDLVIGAQPNIRPEPEVSDEVFGYIEQVYSQDVEWINQSFFAGKKVVEVSGELLAFAGEADRHKSDAITETALLDWSLGRMAELVDRSRNDSVQQLISVSKAPLPVGVPGIPQDFDPLAYILFNSDLLHARVDPESHFKTNGYKEGRQYSFSNRNVGHYMAVAQKLQLLVEEREAQVKQLLEIQNRMAELNAVQDKKLSSLNDLIVQMFRDIASPDRIDGGVKGRDGAPLPMREKRLRHIAKSLHDYDASLSLETDLDGMQNGPSSAS